MVSLHNLGSGTLTWGDKGSKEGQTHIQRKSGVMGAGLLDGEAKHLGSTACLLCTVQEGRRLLFTA